ncbi:hypothetical protein ABT340_15785 [Streptosporangium sp. NPDC000239]|uniref:hypothetical protein n=1 Tax=Streptosporangium sp. NPDC000239 TaxID=3154248 RepID=UPI003319E2B8
MSIGSISTTSYGCFTSAVDNYPLGVGSYEVAAQVTTTHYVEVQIDGYRRTTPVVWPKGGDSTARFVIEIPNDGQAHTVQLVDTGRLGTVAASSPPLVLTSTCVGVLKAEIVETIPDPQTHAKYVTVKVTHDGETSGTFTSRLTMDGKVSGPEIVLSNGDYEPRTVVIPADGAKHLIKAEIQVNGSWEAAPFLWHVVQADSGSAGPLPSTEETSSFFPGETVIIQAVADARPLASDGSEWMKVEYAPKDTIGLWKPVGEDGLVKPDADGFWSTALKTNLIEFPAGSQWMVVVRLVRNHHPSWGTLNYFNMIAGPPGQPSTLQAPIISGPLNHNQRGGCWMELFGTGLPGTELVFEVTAVTSWGRVGDTPLKTTVKRDGTWRTYVYSSQPAKPQPYKILRYRAKARIGSQESAWSNPLDVTWHYPLR